MRRLATVLVGIAAATFTHPAFAGDLCKAGPKSGWMKPEAAQERLRQLGYTEFTLHIEDGCYEAKSVDAQRNKVEVYLHPVSGEIVKTKVKQSG